MSGLRGAFGLEKRSIAATIGGYTQPLIPSRPAYRGVSGMVVTPDAAIQMATVYSCVRLLSDSVSSLPWDAFVKRDRARIDYGIAYGDTPGWVKKPNREMTKLEFIEQVVVSMQLHGNAYALTVRDDYGDVTEVYILHPDDVTILRPQLGADLVYRVRAPGLTGSKPYLELGPDDILHIPMFRLPGSLYGLSPIGAARTTIGAAIAAETSAAAYYGNSAVAGGSIEAPGPMTLEQVKELNDGWNINHQGPHQYGKVGILTNGAQFKPITINASDAQLLETRKFDVEMIARLYRVPIALLGHPVAGAMSFASVEAQNMFLVQHSLRPILERLEQAFSQLLPEDDGFIKFNLDALLRGTTTERYEAYSKGQASGFISLNDILIDEDKPPIGPEGDKYRVPLQNIDIDDAQYTGLELQAKIAAALIDVGFEPEGALEAAGLPDIKHTGVLPTKLQPAQSPETSAPKPNTQAAPLPAPTADGLDS